MPLAFLWVALGGAIGSVARFWLAETAASLVGTAFPWGTLVINALGSFVIGLVASATGPGGGWTVSFEARVFLMAGICGGFTTFSAFSLQTLELLQAGQPTRAFAYVGASVLLCLVCVWSGWIIAASIAR